MSWCPSRTGTGTTEHMKIDKGDKSALVGWPTSVFTSHTHCEKLEAKTQKRGVQLVSCTPSFIYSLVTHQQLLCQAQYRASL